MKYLGIKNLLSYIWTYLVISIVCVNAKASMISSKDRPSDVMGGDFRGNIVDIINYILTFLGLVAVAFIVYAGFLLVTAGGEEDNLNKGKKIITYAAIGIVIVLLAYSIVNVIIGAGD